MVSILLWIIVIAVCIVILGAAIGGAFAAGMLIFEFVEAKYYELF